MKLPVDIDLDSISAFIDEEDRCALPRSLADLKSLPQVAEKLAMQLAGRVYSTIAFIATNCL
jgi:hypothetical protein